MIPNLAFGRFIWVEVVGAWSNNRYLLEIRPRRSLKVSGIEEN
jgi:hypothetical protein